MAVEPRAPRPRLGDRGLEVSDLEFEVHHRALLPVEGRPHGGLVTGRLLEHDVDGSLGSGEDRRSRLLVTDGPPKQLGVVPRQRGGVRRLDSGSHHMPFVRDRTRAPSSGVSLLVMVVPDRTDSLVSNVSFVRGDDTRTKSEPS